MDPKLATRIQKAMLNNYSKNYVECRDIGHVWRTTSTEINGSELNRILCCERCTTERHEVFDKKGELILRRYFHASDYLLNTQGGEIRYTKSFWRGVQFMQATKDKDAATA